MSDEQPKKAGRPSRFYTAEEVAPMFRKSVKTIYRWAKDPKKLPAVRDPGGGILFEAARIDQIVNNMGKALA